MDERILRARARENLRNNWGISIAVAVVAVLLGGLVTGTSFLPELQYGLPLDHFPALQKFVTSENQGLHIGRFTLNFQAGIFGFAAFLLGGVLQIGYADFLLKQHDGKESRFNDLFSKFDYFGTGFAQRFLRSLYVLLWSLLFVIPGVIKEYGYSMTPFILAEHPNLTASQAISLSEDMMDGHKAELFFLDLSFIGWSFLSALTLNLGNIALNPYKNAARAAFYRQLQAEKQYTSYE
jgi:uncharacterized membrane protein